MASAERHGAARYSTRRVLAAEQAILELTEQGRTAGVAIAAADIVARAAADTGLGADQAGAVTRLCQGGERVAVMVGPAGAGKSRSLAAARAAWQAAGVAVRGVAPSAVAAGVLAERAGIRADTRAKFLLDAEAGRIRLLPGEVVVCDEASMVSTRDLARLVTLTHAAGGKTVLVGDHRQLGSVDAGGLFRLLATDARAAELTAIRRFSDPWEPDATARGSSSGDRHGRCPSGSFSPIRPYWQAWIAGRLTGRSTRVSSPRSWPISFHSSPVPTSDASVPAGTTSCSSWPARGCCVSPNAPSGSPGRLVNYRSSNLPVRPSGLWCPPLLM